MFHVSKLEKAHSKTKNRPMGKFKIAVAMNDTYRFATFVSYAGRRRPVASRGSFALRTQSLNIINPVVGYL